MNGSRIIDHFKAVVTQNMNEAGLTGPDPMVKSRRNIVLYGYSNSLLFNLTSGAFLSGFWLALSADADWISTVIMLASLANILQIFAPFWLQRVSDPKRILMIMRIIQHSFNLFAAAVVPLLGLPDEQTLRIVLVLVVIGYVLGAMTGPGLQMWHMKSIPVDRRLGFFSFLHATNVIVTFSAMFLGGLFTDWLGAITSQRLAFLLLRFLLIFVAVIDLRVLSKIDNPGVPGAAAKRRKQGLLDLPRHIMSHRIYLFTILAAALWAVSSALPGQYFIVYLISDLDFSYSFITGVSLLNLVVIIFLTPVWKKVIARLAWMRSFSLGGMLYALGIAGLAFVGPGPGGMILFVLASFYIFVMAVGISLSFSNLTYINMPEENQTSFIALFNATFHAAVLLGVWLGNRFMLLTAAAKNEPGFLGLVNAQLLLLTAAGLIWLSSLLIWQIGRIERPVNG